MKDQEFPALVADAYEHLYDLVYLREHELLSGLPALGEFPVKARARELQRALLLAFDEMDPGPLAPVHSNEMRRHRLMLLRYERGLAPQEVADQLLISRRHYYRVHDSAIDTAAKALRRLLERGNLSDDSAAGSGSEEAEVRLELLRLESARVAQADRYASVGGVLDGVIRLLRDILESHSVQVVAQVPASLPSVSADRSLLRQTMLAALGYLVEQSQDAELWLTAAEEVGGIRVSAEVSPASGVHEPCGDTAVDALVNLEELAALTGVRLLPIYGGTKITGFDIRLPVVQRVVLVVDDNEDLLALFRRYLSPHRYRVLTAQTASEALEIALDQQPFAITLDLMMPEKDGWDLLQSLLNCPETESIPVIVCTVLKQKDLALSLGAAAFLEKPISEEQLLRTLDAIG